MTTDHITRAFEALTGLPDLDGGYLRHLFFVAINDPALATDRHLAEHLLLVPRVLRAALEPAFVRQIPTNPDLEIQANIQLGNVAAAVVIDIAPRGVVVSPETLMKLCRLALRDPRFLAHFLEGHPVSPFL